MSNAQLEVQLIAIVVSASCALPGVFLVLRKMAMMSDAISHSILFGIVLAFFVTQDLASPFLVFSAALTGVLTVVLVELLQNTRLVQKDTAIGLIFPFLFSLGVIMISRYAGNVHLDIDAVLLGELAFAPFNRFILFDYDIGPRSLYVMLGILFLNLSFIIAFYKELKLVTFDAGLASALGFSPAIIHYSLMTLVSITAVGAFDAVGSILVVAFMIGPPAIAFLLTERLSRMIIYSLVIGTICSIVGYWMAHALDSSIAGSITTVIGIVFTLVFFFAPKDGFIAKLVRRRQQKWEFAMKMLLVHLYQHQDLPRNSFEFSAAHLVDHFQWNEAFAAKLIHLTAKRELIQQANKQLELTEKGYQLAQTAIIS